MAAVDGLEALGPDRTPEAPRPATWPAPSPRGQGYRAGTWQGHPSASSLGSFLLPAGTCPGWERRVPGSDPDAGSAPAWSTRGQRQRGPIPGSTVTSPRPEPPALVAQWLGRPQKLGTSAPARPRPERGPRLTLDTLRW